MPDPVLSVENLRTHFFTRRGVVKAVDGVDLTIREGEVLALLGESGCGKSVTSLSLMRLIPAVGAKIVAGRIRFQGRDLLELSAGAMRELRGASLSMIFQEPRTSLNPVFTIGRQISETLIRHERLSRKKARERTIQLLKEVGLSDPESRFSAYPHELSGGMCQRVMIAMAIACNPALLIADEPTTALDVTIQKQILALIHDLCARRNTAVLLITHDLGVVAENADRVAVMYAGRIVEEATVEELFKRPAHPYARGLLDSMPDLDRESERLPAIPGNVPDLLSLPAGCPFAPRCPRADARCRADAPPWVTFSPSHRARCWNPLAPS